ncbi:MAG TPA: hypothetical protein VJ938_09855, partial [Acidimicrobiia bacterium]|nr:hypothetical protein [Acidimicrobiia bacterium]
MPMAPAYAAPAIELLNPSDYNTTPELSAKNDVDGAYHFVAWVPQVPADPFVEFEVGITDAVAITIEAQRVGSTDTWEAFHNLAGVADGAGFVRAILYSGQTQHGESDSQAVTINNDNLAPPPAAETAEILHPLNGGPLGFFNPPTGRPNALIDVQLSESALQARVMYTKSAPGSDPEWTQCGSGPPNDTGFARVRCTLADGDSPNQVRAIAATANFTPAPAPGQPAADESGDAHSVTIYDAVPARVDIEPSARSVPVATCFGDPAGVLLARALDQQNRPLANPQIDVHAVGPSDQLQFGVLPGQTDSFKPPDKGPHSSEAARRCTGTAPEDRQGETNRVREPDEKHIESDAEFIDEGQFAFTLRADEIGGTQVIAFADQDDDDVQDPTEAAGGASIGWGQDPPAPVSQVFIDPTNPSAAVGSCQPFTVTVKEGGNPVSSGNVDVHLSGAEAAPSFCTPSGGSPMRDPDSGEHVAGVHSDGIRHQEGDLSSSGQLTFGVTAASAGEVTVVVWLDESDDDTQTSG